jgi:hypothetical protein
MMLSPRVWALVAAEIERKPIAIDLARHARLLLFRGNLLPLHLIQEIGGSSRCSLARRPRQTSCWRQGSKNAKVALAHKNRRHHASDAG